MKRSLLVTLLLTACAPGYWDPPAAPPISAAELDRACISAAGDRLANLLGREASRGRIVPISADMAGSSRYIIDERMVELDSMSVGVPTTYVFYCARTTGGSIIAKSVGRKV